MARHGSPAQLNPMSGERRVWNQTNLPDVVQEVTFHPSDHPALEMEPVGDKIERTLIARVMNDVEQKVPEIFRLDFEQLGFEWIHRKARIQQSAEVISSVRPREKLSSRPDVDPHVWPAFCIQLLSSARGDRFFQERKASRRITFLPVMARPVTMNNQTTTPEPDRLVSLSHAAERLDISIRTLYRLIAQKQLPEPVKVGRASKLYQSDLNAYLVNLKANRP